MTLSLDSVLIVIALVMFAIATVNANVKFNAVAAGLFCMTLTLVV